MRLAYPSYVREFDYNHARFSSFRHGSGRSYPYLAYIWRHVCGITVQLRISQKTLTKQDTAKAAQNFWIKICYLDRQVRSAYRRYVLQFNLMSKR